MWHVVESHTTSKLKQHGSVRRGGDYACILTVHDRIADFFPCILIYLKFGVGVLFCIFVVVFSFAVIPDQKTITTYFLISSTHCLDRSSLVAIYIMRAPAHKLRADPWAAFNAFY